MTALAALLEVGLSSFSDDLRVEVRHARIEGADEGREGDQVGQGLGREGVHFVDLGLTEERGVTGLLDHRGQPLDREVASEVRPLLREALQAVTANALLPKELLSAQGRIAADQLGGSLGGDALARQESRQLSALGGGLLTALVARARGVELKAAPEEPEPAQEADHDHRASQASAALGDPGQTSPE